MLFGFESELELHGLKDFKRVACDKFEEARDIFQTLENKEAEYFAVKHLADLYDDNVKRT